MVVRLSWRHRNRMAICGFGPCESLRKKMRDILTYTFNKGYFDNGTVVEVPEGSMLPPSVNVLFDKNGRLMSFKGLLTNPQLSKSNGSITTGGTRAFLLDRDTVGFLGKITTAGGTSTVNKANGNMIQSIGRSLWFVGNDLSNAVRAVKLESPGYSDLSFGGVPHLMYLPVEFGNGVSTLTVATPNSTAINVVFTEVNLDGSAKASPITFTVPVKLATGDNRFAVMQKITSALRAHTGATESDPYFGKYYYAINIYSSYPTVTYNYATSPTTFTTATAHGLTNDSIIRFYGTYTLPTTSPQITIGPFYDVTKLTDTTFEVFANSGATKVTLDSSAGSGNLDINYYWTQMRAKRTGYRFKAEIVVVQGGVSVLPLSNTDAGNATTPTLDTEADLKTIPHFSKWTGTGWSTPTRVGLPEVESERAEGSIGLFYDTGSSGSFVGLVQGSRSVRVARKRLGGISIASAPSNLVTVPEQGGRLRVLIPAIPDSDSSLVEDTTWLLYFTYKGLGSTATHKLFPLEITEAELRGWDLSLIHI